MKISVIVSTYNRPDALNAVLAGFCQQKEIDQNDWELIIADDGSRDANDASHRTISAFFW